MLECEKVAYEHSTEGLNKEEADELHGMFTKSHVFVPPSSFKPREVININPSLKGLPTPIATAFFAKKLKDASESEEETVDSDKFKH